jgi:hypothetical protein
VEYWTWLATSWTVELCCRELWVCREIQLSETGCGSSLEGIGFREGTHLKFTGGLFSRERYGLDARWMMPVNSWLMLQARAGLTSTWWCSTKEQTFEGKKWTPTAIVGANFWIDKWHGRINQCAIG